MGPHRILIVALALVLWAASASAQDWLSVRGRDHPLVGRIWDVGAGRYVSEDELLARLRGTRYVLLGESHDNADHHRLQARLIGGLVNLGRRPIVAFEQLDTSQQGPLDRYLMAPGDAAGIGRAVKWSEGWPDWRLYQPIAEAALRGGLTLIAANFTDADLRAAMRDPTRLEPKFAARTGATEPLPEAERRALERELVNMHCGVAGPGVQQMLIGQRIRDAAFADALVQKDEGDGGVLIAGAGHTRTDRAVPYVLKRLAPEATVAALAFVEVQTGFEQPAGYARLYDAPAIPYDVVWFTPAPARSGVAGGDPCR